MKKRISYILLLFVMFLLMGSAKAYQCTYYWEYYGEIKTDTYAAFIVETDGTIKDGGAWSKGDIDCNKREPIQNWTDKYAGFSAKLYASVQACPSVLLFFEDDDEKCYFYVSDYSSYEKIKEQFDEEIGYDDYKFMTLDTVSPKLGFFDVQFKYESDYDNNQEQITIVESIPYSGLSKLKIPENKFDTPTGYDFTGWHVYFYDSVTGKEELYGQNANEFIYTNTTTVLIKPNENFSKIFNQFEFKIGDIFILRAQWVKNDELTPTYINEYRLGENVCKDQGYVWNETAYRNYCNVDNLMYISCGGAFDIPHEAPQLFSFAVNFLKILTPIILIVVSIISLLKALAASNEDEIKKAQKGLIRKVIAAVMVFFIISIVQFVTMKVADTAEKEDISSCLTCFLNNDCGNTLYYKTNVAGTYMCTNLETGVPDECQEEK